MTNLVKGLLVGISVFFFIGCNGNMPEEKAEPKSKAAAAVSSDTTAKGESRVTQVVFIGQKESCPCTRKRIDEAWPVLEKVLGGYENIAVKRLQNDVEVEEADKYDGMQTVMVAPGIFFLDKDDKLVDMIQGAVTEEQIISSLKK